MTELGLFEYIAMPIAFAIAIVLVILKATGVLALSWLVVLTSFIWIPLSLIAVGIVIFLIGSIGMLINDHILNRG